MSLGLARLVRSADQPDRASREIVLLTPRVVGEVACRALAVRGRQHDLEVRDRPDEALFAWRARVFDALAFNRDRRAVRQRGAFAHREIDRSVRRHAADVGQAVRALPSAF